MKRITSFMSIKEVILSFITAIILTLGLYVGVQATWVYNGTIFGRFSYHGYFDDNPYGEHEYGDDVLPSDPSTSMAIPDFSNTTDPDDQFIIFLKSANNWRDENPYASQQQVTGSAFIVNTMLGRNGPGNGKNISEIDWQTLTDLLDSYQKKGNINWNKDSGPRDINSYYQKKGGSGYDDDAFYGSWTSGASIYIKNDDGSVAYILLRACANPTGQFDNLKDTTKKWNITTTSTPNKKEAYPGDTITWTHVVKNDGPDATSESVNYYYQDSDKLGNLIGNKQDSDHSFPSGNASGTTGSFGSTHIVNTSDVGSEICRVTIAIPRASDDGSLTKSTAACVTVPIDYNLIPNVSTNPSGVIESGVSFNVDSSISNSGTTQNDPLANWKLVKTISQPGFPDIISSQSGGNVVVAAKSKVAPLARYTEIDTDKSAGTSICFVLSVQPYSSAIGGNSWRSSLPACLKIGKKPKVQIWGGDLRANAVTTSASDKAGYRFGSWVEYAIFAKGIISGTASGSAFASQSGLSFNPNTETACKYNTLSFANVPVGKTNCTGAAESIGNYSNSYSIPDVAASFPVGVLTPNVTPNLNNLQGIYTGGDNVTISGGNIQKGQWIVVNASNANITITGNINYTNGQLHGIADIPQVVIIANNINIANDVTNIDAWLIAKSSINTCSSSVPGTSLTINMCSQPLTVNGPVMTGKLYLQRTAGSGIGATSGDPAEVFNLRPDAYLWSIVRASTSGKIQTVYSTELPPRF